MRTAYLTEENIKLAVISYCLEQRMDEPAYDPGHFFSQRYKDRMAKILSRKSRRTRLRKTLRGLAAVVASLVLILGVAVLSSPTAYAALRNWTLNISNMIADYSFAHSEDTHAFIVCSPKNLPDGFEEAESYHSGYYTRKLYKNSLTGEYIRFEYRKPTDAQISRIEKRAVKAEQIQSASGVQMNAVSKKDKNQLFWYDAERHLAYYIESGLPSEVLADAFGEMEIRLPRYSPAWLPDGYMLADDMDYYPYHDLVYANVEGDVIIFGYSDMAETSLISVESSAGEDVLAEALMIGTNQGYYHPHTDERSGGDLVIIDEKNCIVFTIESLMDRETVVRIAESIVCTETEW